MMLLAAFLLAPLAASLIPEKYAIDRALVLVPTGALIGGFGVDWLLMPRMWLAAWPARALCLGLFVWMCVQFDGFYREYLTAYPIRASFWFDGNHPGAFEPIVSQHARDDQRFIYLSAGLPRVKDHWKLYLFSRGRIDLLKRTVLFKPEDIHFDAVRPGSLLLTGAGDPVERLFLKMAEVKVVAHITEPDSSASFTIFERTPWTPFYRFDGTYSVKMEITCTPSGHDVCASLATTALCPSMETSNLVVDRCGYLNQAAITNDGLYNGVSNYGIAVNGTFATTGTFRLSGSGVSAGRHYELTFLLTKRD